MLKLMVFASTVSPSSVCAHAQSAGAGAKTGIARGRNCSATAAAPAASIGAEPAAARASGPPRAWARDRRERGRGNCRQHRGRIGTKCRNCGGTGAPQDPRRNRDRHRRVPAAKSEGLQIAVRSGSFWRIPQRSRPDRSHRTVRVFARGGLFPRGKGSRPRALQPSRARSPALFSPACFFPDPRRNRLISPCSSRLKFPVPRPRQPATGGLQSPQRHDIAWMTFRNEAPTAAKKIPC